MVEVKVFYFLTAAIFYVILLKQQFG